MIGDAFISRSPMVHSSLRGLAVKNSPRANERLELPFPSADDCRFDVQTLGALRCAARVVGKVRCGDAIGMRLSVAKEERWENRTSLEVIKVRST